MRRSGGSVFGGTLRGGSASSSSCVTAVTAATASVHANVVVPAAQELVAGPGRSATESATQALSRVSPSQQHEPLTVVLLGLALAALIGRRRAILVRSR